MMDRRWRRTRSIAVGTCLAALGLAGCGSEAEPTSETTSSEAQKVLSAMQDWESGDERAAIETLLAMDWTADVRFGRDCPLFAMTESQCVALAADKRREVLDEVTSQLPICQEIGRECVALAQEARAAGDHARAETTLRAAVNLGQLLDRDADRMLIVRLSGIAVQRRALEELSSLYAARGEQGKLDETREHIHKIQEELREVKRVAAGQ